MKKYPGTSPRLPTALFSLLALLLPVVHGKEKDPPPRGEATAILGKKAQFDCSVKSPDNAAELEIWWQFGSKNITNSDRFDISVKKSADGNVSTHLIISSVHWNDVGLYSCVAKEREGRSGQQTSMGQNIMLDVLGELSRKCPYLPSPQKM